MKKLTLALSVSALMSASAMAGHHEDKIAHTFHSLDKDGDGMLTQQEAGDHAIADYFAKLDENSDNMLSEDEYVTYLEANPDMFASEVKDKVQYTEAKVVAEREEVLDKSPKELKTDETQVASMDGDYDTEQQDTEYMDDEMKDSMQSAQAHGEDAMHDVATLGDDADLRNHDEMTGTDTHVDETAEFAKADANNDGKISVEEAKMANMYLVFEELDENQDDMITREEYREFRKSEQVGY